jgi:hypothetical protein
MRCFSCSLCRPWPRSWVRSCTRSGLQSAPRAVLASSASSMIRCFSCSPCGPSPRSWEEAALGLGYNLFLGQLWRQAPRQRSAAFPAVPAGGPWPRSWVRSCTRSRLQSAPRAILASSASSTIRCFSLRTVASKLGKELHSVWATICSSGDSGVKRLVDDLLLFLQFPQIVASKLGKELHSVWTTVCSSGEWAVKHLVEDPDRFVDALIIVADENSMSAWEVFCMFAGCSSSLWYQLINEPDSVGKILSDTPYDNYALVKLDGRAETNFWRNAEVRGAAQAHLINEDWAKIKAVLSNQAVDTAEKFDTAISILTPEDTPKYTPNGRARQCGDPPTKSTGSIGVTSVAMAMVPSKLLICTLN